MEHKNLIATIYLKDGEAVKSREDFTIVGDWKALAKFYNESGVDKLYIFDLSQNDKEHDIHLEIIKHLSRIIEIPVYGGGNITKMEDIKKILYAGCKGAILDGSRHDIIQMAQEAAPRFGKEKLLISMETVDLMFKHKKEAEEYVHKLVVLNENIVEALANIADMPFSVIVPGYSKKLWLDILKRDCVTGIGGDYVSNPDTDIVALKKDLDAEGIQTRKFVSAIPWSEFKLNADGLIPVIVQEYQTCEVLMLAYMNEEAYKMTLALGKMTYYSRSRKELWIKGETSGHYQYVKSLTIDCDKDTILANVSQVGAACHTGNPTCFFQELVKKQYISRNPLEIFEDMYDSVIERKEHPREGSYTNYLFDKGLDKILQNIGEEATEIVIAAKNTEPEEITYEICDFIHDLIIMMVETGITWEDVVEELNQRLF